MKRIAILALGALALGTPVLAPMVVAQSATPAGATQATADYFIANMTCGLCPVTVNAAMSRVNGVESVEIDIAARTVHVVFDPSLTDAATIAAASEQAGYTAAIQS